MRFSADRAAVPYIKLLGGLITARYLVEFAHVADGASPCLLPINPVQVEGFPLFDLLDLMDLVFSAERTVCPEFTWHFHEMCPVTLDNKSQYY
jgi:hypothetical protein